MTAGSVRRGRRITGPRLDAAEEQALLRRWRGRGDRSARDAVVLAHRPVAVAAARAWRASGVPLDDLIHEAMIGLFQAADRFDPERGVRFSTYARWWAQAAVSEYVARNRSAVRPGRDAAPDYPGDVALEALEAAGIGLPTPDPSPEEQVLAASERAWVRAAVAHVAAGLGARQRAIVAHRLLAEDGPTLAALGRRFGITAERVRQLEREVLDLVKARLNRTRLKPSPS